MLFFVASALAEFWASNNSKCSAKAEPTINSYNGLFGGYVFFHNPSTVLELLLAHLA